MRKLLWFTLRFSAWSVMVIAWPALLKWICWGFNKLGYPIFDFIFVVYPGTPKQARGYAPDWVRTFIAPYIAVISTIGIIKKGTKSGRGLVVTVPWTAEEIHKGHYLEKITTRVTNMSAAIGVKSIALAGRIPSMLKSNGYSPNGNGIVLGDKGALFTITQSLFMQVSKKGLLNPRIGILGYGFLGEQLIPLIKASGITKHNIIVVDPRTPSNGVPDYVEYSNTPDVLSVCDLIIVLTGTGKQADKAIKYLREDVVVIDDTHPQMPRYLNNNIRKNGGTIVKATLEIEGVSFLPRLPGWEASWLPGCCVHAMVLATNGGFINSQDEFNRRAKEMGFRALDVSNKEGL